MKISSNSFEPGKLLIKINPDFEKLLPDVSIVSSSDEYVKTGIDNLDVLNNQFYITQYQPCFSDLYKQGMKTNEFRDRHRAWGFHLWFELSCSPGTDIIKAVQLFSSAKEIDIAEPVYKIVHVNCFESLFEISSEINPQELSGWEPNDPQYDDQWHYDKINMPDAWEIEKGSTNIVVAIVDHGIQFDHPDLSDNMWEDANGNFGYNFVDNSSTIIPGSHGTHVAGTVSAVTNNNTGVAGIAGGSGSGNGVLLMSCQVFRGEDQGGFGDAAIWAADNNAAISQNSWSYEDPDVYNSSALDAIDYFDTNGGGNVMNGGISIFSAGNENSSDHYYPAYYSKTLAVAATNEDDEKAYFSNYGEWIDISAPGLNVRSTDINDNYSTKHGTSMACPHVSGVAALILSHANRYGLVINNDDLWNIIIENVDDHYQQNPDFIGLLGSGRINAQKTLTDLPNYFPQNIVLYSPNTSGMYTASQSIHLIEGFSTGQSPFTAHIYELNKTAYLKVFFNKKLIIEKLIEYVAKIDYSTLLSSLNKGSISAESGEYTYEIFFNDEKIESAKLIVE